jgi:hypothetical protein
MYWYNKGWSKAYGLLSVPSEGNKTALKGTPELIFGLKIAFNGKDCTNATFCCVIVMVKNYVLGLRRDKPDFLSDRLLVPCRGSIDG